MNKIKYYLNKIKEKGIDFTLLFMLNTIWYSIYKRVYQWYLRNFTRLNGKRVIFMSNPDFSDNSKVFYDYLYVHCPDLKFIWLFSQDNELPPSTSRTVFIYKDAKYHHGPSRLMLKYIMTSKYIFFTHQSPIKNIPERNGQIVINLWHGCGYKAVDKKEENHAANSNFDYALVPGPIFVKTKKEFWGCKEEQILTIGYPRYDLMLKGSKKGYDFAFKIRGGCDKLVIWMPTFRNTGRGKFPEEEMKMEFDIPLLQSIEEIKQLDRFCEKMGVVLCIKRHVYQLRYSCEDAPLNNIIFISNDDLKSEGIDLYSFLQYTEALISDYSSVAIDYLLLDKPIAFCLDDYEEYKATRGFVFENPLDYMPGNHLYNLEDLESFISDVCEGKDEYKTQRAKVREVAQNPCDNYCKRVWDTVRML